MFRLKSRFFDGKSSSESRLLALWHFARVAALSGLLAACGGGGSDSVTPPPAPTTHTVGGTVTGLAASTTLQVANGTDLVAISAAGGFTLPTPLTAQQAYTVTVSQQPTGQFCNVANGSGTVASQNIVNIVVACAKTFAGGTGTLAAAGGAVSTAAADVVAPSGASLKQQTVTVTSIAPPAGLPATLNPIGAAIDVAIDQPDVLNAPFLITLRYDAAAVSDEDQLAVVHYNTALHRYEPVTIVKQDKTAHSFQIEARSFSPFLVAAFSALGLPASHSVSNFTPANNGWNIQNFGSYYSSGGNCLGMSGYATWFFANNAAALSGKYSATGNPSIAQLVAARAHLAQSQYWAQKSNTYLSGLGKPATALLMKTYLALFDQPLILLLGQNGSPRHASVLYGYDSNGFQFYDVNVVGAAQNVAFDGTNWGTYAGYNSFSYVAIPSLGRTEDFARLTTQAEGGFTTSSLIAVTSPTASQQITGHSVALTGTLSGSLNSNASMIAYVKGVPQLIASTTGAFSATLPISTGDNTIVLFAGVDLSLQSNWYANAATLILDVTGTGAETKLLATLTWNQDNTDVDMYVTEPSPSGQTAWFASKSTSNQLNLDFDNTQGFGPEHTTLVTLGNTAGTVLPGQYPIWVHYYSDHGSGQAVTGTVTILVNEGQPNQQLLSKNFSIAVSNPANAIPGSTGPDWVQIGVADLVAGTIALTP